MRALLMGKNNIISPREPTANTLFYFPLDVTNKRNSVYPSGLQMSVSGISTTYYNDMGVSIPGGTTAKIMYTSFSLPSTNAYTILIWIKLSLNEGVAFSVYNNSTDIFILNQDTQNNKTQILLNNTDVRTGNGLLVGWYLFAVTVDGQGGYNFYIIGDDTEHYTATGTVVTGTLNVGINKKMQSSSTYTGGTFSNLITENYKWATQQVNGYFEQTKNSYLVKSIELDFTQGEQGASWMTQTGGTASYTLGTGFTFNSGFGMYGHRLKLPDRWTGSGTFKSIKIWGTLPNNKAALGIEEGTTGNVIRYAENGTTKVMTYYTNQPSAYYDVGGTFPSDVEMTINIDYATHTYTGTVNGVDYSIQPSYSLDFWKDAWLRGELVIHVSGWRANAVIVISKVLITLE